MCGKCTYCPYAFYKWPYGSVEVVQVVGELCKYDSDRVEVSEWKML